MCFKLDFFWAVLVVVRLGFGGVRAGGFLGKGVRCWVLGVKDNLQGGGARLQKSPRAQSAPGRKGLRTQKIRRWAGAGEAGSGRKKTPGWAGAGGLGQDTKEAAGFCGWERKKPRLVITSRGFF